MDRCCDVKGLMIGYGRSSRMEINRSSILREIVMAAKILGQTLEREEKNRQIDK